MSDAESECERDTGESNFFDDPAIEVVTYLDTVQTQEGDHSHTTELSTAILDRVDSALQFGGREQALYVFRLLMNRQTLDLFLQLRCEARKQKDISFTWVDDILSKLGTLVLSVISDNYQGNPIYRGTLRNQVERDAVRAASQLPGKPDCWEVFPSALNAQHLSPAAKRLILRLQFGVLVMQAELGGTRVEYSGREIQVVLNALETSAKDYVQFDPLTGIPVISKDAVDCAFFLALYTTLNTIQHEVSSPPEELVAHTPYIETHLLALTDFVLHSADESSRSATGSVLPVICFHWGKLVPWCWAARADHRLANAEIVVITTTHWLQTMDCHGICTYHRQCKLATIHLTEHPIAGCIALSDVLLHGTSQLLEHGGSCNNSLIRLLDKSCFLLSLVFRELSLKNNGESYERLKPHISRIGWSVLQLCVIRPGFGPRGMHSQAIETEYLNLLLTIDGGTIHQCLMELQRDHHLQFSSKVDHVLSEAKAQVLDEELLSPLQVSMVRFALGFLTVICSSGTRGIILRENVFSLFTRLFNHLVVGTHRIQYGEALLGPSVTALIIAEKYFRPSRPLDSLVRNEGVLGLCLRARWGRESTASLALAQYVIHGDYPQKWLLILETLDHFRGLILATIRQVSQNLGRFSQIACPTFCLAMVRLLAGIEDVEARVAYRFFISSPWTKELVVELNKFRLSISTSVGSDPCRDRTSQMLGDIIVLLIQVLSDSNGLSISMPAIEIPKFDIRLCFEQSEVVIAMGDTSVE